MRVPEAYPLLGPYEATRPGLLVLDADGRRVDALSFEPVPDAAAVARFLREAGKAPALERFTLRVKAGAAALATAVKKVPGVEKVEEKEGTLFVAAKSGALAPKDLVALAEKAGAAIEFAEPVPVAFPLDKSLDPLGVARGLSGTAGAWFVAVEEGRVRAWVTGLLLDPARLEAAAGCRSDLEARRYDLPGVSTGPPGMRIALALRALPEVLAVIPALAGETVTVVGRREKVHWPGVLTALRGTGVEARESGK